MKRTVLFMLIGIGLLVPTRASAHVLLSDQYKQSGAVLHINPDDDPVAGEPSGLFFDIQDKAVNQENYSFSLSIEQDTQRILAPITIQDSGIYASYTFPAQGVYKIILSAEPVNIANKPLVFVHTQRISRGIQSGAAIQKTHLWAEIGVIAGLSGFMVLGIIIFNRRKALAEYSRSRS